MIWSGYLSLVTFSAIILLAWWQSRALLRGLGRADREGPESFRNDYSPPVCVILCLKGGDPFLDRCLAGLARQNYPDYRLMVVVDSPEDEALAYVDRARQAFGDERIEVVFRDVDLKTCGRRCSSLLSAFQRISDGTEAIVICDGDAITQPTWLQELISPMRDREVLATSGNRWYVPPEGDWAALVRYCWNAIAVSSMASFHMPWGGSVAIRTEVLRDPAYLDLISQAFVDDLQLGRYLEMRGKDVVSVFPTVLLNEEGITFRSFWGFLERQIVAVRLNHWAWPYVLADGLAISAVVWVFPTLTLLGGVQNFLLGWLLPGIAYLTFVTLHTARYERLVRKTQLAWHGRALPPLSVARQVKTLIALLLTGPIYSATILNAWWLRRHVWRGVHYRFEGRRVSIQHIDAAPAPAPALRRAA